MEPNAERNLGRWLIWLHALERQASVQLAVARRLVSSADLADDLERHQTQTTRHREMVERLLADRGMRASRLQDAGATLNRGGFLLYTALGSDAPGKMLADSIAYEHLEIAAYRMLAHASSVAGDAELYGSALTILSEEQDIAGRLATRFDWAIEESARGEPTEGQLAGDRARSDLRRHLRHVYALAAQARLLLAITAHARPRAPTRLREYARFELPRVSGQRSRLARRLSELGGRPSLTRSAAMAAAGAGWSAAWAVQPLSEAKLTCFLYAERHLEIAAYELLTRDAARVGDQATRRLAAQGLSEHQTSAGALEELLPLAAEAALRIQ